MNNIIYKDRNELELELKKYVLVKTGISSTSALYRYRDEVLLCFDPEFLPDISHEVSNIISSINITPFIFPSEYIFIDEKIHGYKMNYVSGINLDKIDLRKYPLVYLLEAIKQLITGINYMSMKNIWCYDLCKYNIMCDKEKFSVIDTAEYQIANNKEECSKNYYIFNEIYEMLFFNLPEVKKFILDTESLKIYYKKVGILYNYNYNFDEFLTTVYNELVIFLNQDFKTMQEANKKIIEKQLRNRQTQKKS